MSAADQVGEYLRGLATLAETVAARSSPEILALADKVVDALQAGRKVMFCGNGGSAADAQHLATEYVVRFRRQRQPLAALALTTNTSLLTAASNDLGFEEVFARQVEAFGRPGDILFLHSTSGKSPNLLRAAAAARDCGVQSIALLAAGGGPLATVVDAALVLPTDNVAHAQELQLAIGHIICDLAEARMTGQPA